MTQKVVDYDFLNPNNDNEIIVRLKTSDLDNDNTYYIRLVYNGIIWQQSDGQRIVIGYGDNGTSSGDNGNGNENGNGSIIDTIGIENKLNLINNTIKSGDNAIISKLNEHESGEQARFEYWVGFFNLSGDNSNLVLNESGDIFGIRYQNIDNFGIFDFLSTTFNSLYNLLFNNSQNVSLSMGQFGTLNSADFVINNNSLNGFLYFTINPTLILITIFFYYRFIKMVATINLKVFDSYDIDNNIKLF